MLAEGGSILLRIIKPITFQVMGFNFNTLKEGGQDEKKVEY